MHFNKLITVWYNDKECGPISY